MSEATPRAVGLGGRGLLAFAWGTLGVVLLLAQALHRLVPRALEAVTSELSLAQWTLLAVWVGFMAHAEGVRGFHRRFSPRVVARALALAEHGRLGHVLLAPAYCMSLLHAPTRRLIVSWTMLLGIVALVILVARVAQPWRGIIDAGVVVGLAIGLASLVWHALRALRGVTPPVGPDLPGEPSDGGAAA